MNCPECGGEVKMTKQIGRAFSYMHRTIVVPMIELPQCEKCMELYLDGDDADRLDAVLEPLYMAEEAAFWDATKSARFPSQEKLEEFYGPGAALLSPETHAALSKVHNGARAALQKAQDAPLDARDSAIVTENKNNLAGPKEKK